MLIPMLIYVSEFCPCAVSPLLENGVVILLNKHKQNHFSPKDAMCLVEIRPVFLEKMNV